MRRRLLPILIAAATWACGEDLKTTDDGPVIDGLVQTAPVEGERETAVQAYDEEVWVRVRFEGTQALHIEDEADPNWHVRFRRIGVELSEGSEAVEIEGDAAAYAAMTTAPSEGWGGEPPPDTEGADGRAGSPLAGWFNYNPVNHTVTAGERFYGLRTPDGGCFKLRFLSYYDEAGTTGVVTFRWAPLTGCR